MFDNDDDRYENERDSSYHSAHEYMYEVLDRDTYWQDEDEPWSDDDDPDWMD